LEIVRFSLPTAQIFPNYYVKEKKGKKLILLKKEGFINSSDYFKYMANGVAAYFVIME